MKLKLSSSYSMFSYSFVVGTKIIYSHIRKAWTMRVVYRSYDNKTKLTSIHLNRDLFFLFTSPQYFGLMINGKVVFFLALLLSGGGT